MKEIRLQTDEVITEYTIAEMKTKGANKFMGWACTVGLECLYIDFDGMMWRGPCRVGGPLGHMLTDWQLPETLAKCTRQTCDCGTGIKLVKFSPNQRVDPIEEQVFNVQWDLGRRCNYDCSYCWPSSHNKTDKWVPFKALKKVVDKIFENYGGKIQFNFAGGEPTLHPEFLELCTYIWEKGHHIHVQTNGTMNVIKARKLANIAEISISVHFEFVNYEKLINNIRAILSAGVYPLEIKMMVDSSDKSFFAALDFKRYLKMVPYIELARVIMSPLRDPVSNDLMSYTERKRGHFGDVEF